MARVEDPRPSTGTFTSSLSLRTLGGRLAATVKAMARLAEGRAAQDEQADAALAATVSGLPSPLRAMRIATLLIPLAAVVLLGINAGYWPLFHFTRSDGIALAIAFLAGTMAAFACYLWPRLTVQAFIALWQLRWPALAAYTALLFVPAALFNSVFLSRLFLGIMLLPVAAAMWMMYWEFRGSNWLARAFPLAFVIMAAVPGFILPPYYQGIAGWTTGIEVGETVTLYGYQFVNDDDERIWVTHTLFTPVTQVGRFPTAWNDKKETIGPIEAFILKAYRRAYPLLKQGYMPHQRYLGWLGYPPHTYATNLPDYSGFPPDSIRRVQFVGLTYNSSDEIVEIQVYSDHEVP